MLVLIFQIIGIVLVTARIVDELEAKGRKSLLFKFLTPAAWFVGQLAGSVIGTVILALGGTDIAALSGPLADTQMSNELFFLLLAQIVGTVVGVGIVYLVARSLPMVEPEAATATPDPS